MRINFFLSWDFKNAPKYYTVNPNQWNNYFSLLDKILKTLGEGTFGRVVKVKDMDK